MLAYVYSFTYLFGVSFVHNDNLRKISFTSQQIPHEVNQEYIVMTSEPPPLTIRTLSKPSASTSKNSMSIDDVQHRMHKHRIYINIHISIEYI